MRKMPKLAVAATALLLALAAPAAAAVPVTVATLDGERLSVEAEGATLAAVMEVLSKRLGFIADLGPEAVDLPVTARMEGEPQELLSRLLRGTNHVLVRDGDRVARVIVFGPGTDAPGLDLADIPAETEGGDLPPPDTLALDKEAAAQGLAPDTGLPSDIAPNIARAIAVTERERATAWAAFARPRE